MIAEKLLSDFTEIVGARNALTEKDDLSHYLNENRNIYFGKSSLVLKPGSTQEVSRILRLANETGTEIVPQGGHTGHVGGGAPDESGEQIVVSLERMNRTREIDLSGNTITVDAGVVLQSIRDIAEENDRLFPLSLGSQGSCQIGGNISSNAGGTGVLAYGNTRELVLGVEVVLANGDIWDGLRKLKKDNTGYSLKNLFVGAEGTLGIVTGAVLKLFPAPKGREICWAAVPTSEAALELFQLAQGIAGAGLTGFELVHRTPLEFVLRNVPDSRDPLEQAHEWYVLTEISSGRSAEDARELAEMIFTQAFERELAIDAVLGESLSQRDAFWKLREDMGDAQIPEGASIKHDISVPVHLIPKFLHEAGEIVASIVPNARLCVFGHMGDGNLHYNVSQPLGGDAEEFLSLRDTVNEQVHAFLLSLGGSVSAEHGIGRLKRDLLARTKSETEMAMMRSIKQALDPKGIMNPGKIV